LYQLHTLCVTLIHYDHYGYDYHNDDDDDEDDKEGNHHDQQEQDADEEEIQPLTALSLWYEIGFAYLLPAKKTDMAMSQNPGTLGSLIK